MAESRQDKDFHPDRHRNERCPLQGQKKKNLSYKLNEKITG